MILLVIITYVQKVIMGPKKVSDGGKVNRKVVKITEIKNNCKVG